MARITVFGIGYVGVVSAACLARDGHEVVAVDLDEGRVATVNAGRSPIVEKDLEPLIAEGVASGRLRATTDAAEAVANTEISFVCVGTPSDPDGAVGLKFVRAVSADIGHALAKKDGFHSVVMRSTIVPGTMQNVVIPALEEASGKRAGTDFGVGYFPEFLRESTAIEDYYDPGLVVFGSLDKLTGDFLSELNKDLPCESHSVDLPTAEMVKYTSNAWRAVKITFANEIGNVAKSVGLDGQLVMRLLASDTKIAMSSAFLRPGFAFGGSCLPKDVRALTHLAQTREVPTPLLAAVLEANEAQIVRAEDMVNASGAHAVGLVGVSFKAGTDDLRESPLADLAARLIDSGKTVRIYDPYVATAFAADPAAAGRGNAVVPDLSTRMESSIAKLIETSDIVLVGNYYEEAQSDLMAAMSDRSMIDLTRIDRSVVSNGSYQGICW